MSSKTTLQFYISRKGCQEREKNESDFEEYLCC